MERGRGSKRIKEGLERTKERPEMFLSYAPSLAGRVRGGSSHIQLCAPNVVAMAVRMVMRMLRIFPQVELLLKVPIVLNVLWVRH